jgi:hypothetical protein
LEQGRAGLGRRLGAPQLIETQPRLLERARQAAFGLQELIDVLAQTLELAA